jgi:threonine dehydrogenase-like Zn-dependent dehydrogenase
LIVPSKIELRTFPRPRIGLDDALLKIEANGIRGTDVHFRTSVEDVLRVLGHEVAGRIAEIGDRAVSQWQAAVGDRVAVEARIARGSYPDWTRRNRSVALASALGSVKC